MALPWHLLSTGDNEITAGSIVVSGGSTWDGRMS